MPYNGGVGGQEEMTNLNNKDVEGGAFDKFGPRPLRLEDLPPLPERGPLYWQQPWVSVIVVGGLSCILVYPTRQITLDETMPAPQFRVWLFWLIHLWAILATACTAFIVFGSASQVNRSEETCFPIPEEVERKLRASESLAMLKNIESTQKSRTHGTYCVRCCVWRPPSRDPVYGGKLTNAHHCSICQRCVVGFDHHCDFFGRCIVAGNMPCFTLTISMLWAGLITAGVAFFIWAGGEDASRLAATGHHHQNLAERTLLVTT